MESFLEIRSPLGIAWFLIHLHVDSPVVMKEDSTCTINTYLSFPLSCSAKRPAGMSGILSHIGGKKSKMSTLEKSKMDWDAFKSEEGIGEELAIHNRGREG